MKQHDEYSEEIAPHSHPVSPRFWWQKNKGPAIFAVLIICLLIVVEIGASRDRLRMPLVSQKTWQIDFSYNAKEEVFDLGQVNITSQQIVGDPQGLSSSQYKILVFDRNGGILYQRKVSVVESLSRSNTVYIPYFDNGAKISLKRGEKEVLVINLQ